MITALEKVLTNNSPTVIATIAIPQGYACSGHLFYSVIAKNPVAGDSHVHTGLVLFAATNKGGVIATDIQDETVTTTAEARSKVSSLTEAWTVAAGTNNITVSANFNYGEANPSLMLYGELMVHGALSVA